MFYNFVRYLNVEQTKRNLAVQGCKYLYKFLIFLKPDISDLITDVKTLQSKTDGNKTENKSLVQNTNKIDLGDSFNLKNPSRIRKVGDILHMTFPSVDSGMESEDNKEQKSTG